MPARTEHRRLAQASAEHLQFASLAFGEKDGLTTANPIATAIAILISASIILVFLSRNISLASERVCFCRVVKPERARSQKRGGLLKNHTGFPEPA